MFHVLLISISWHLNLFVWAKSNDDQTNREKYKHFPIVLLSCMQTKPICRNENRSKDKLFNHFWIGIYIGLSLRANWAAPHAFHCIATQLFPSIRLTFVDVCVCAVRTRVMVDGLAIGFCTQLLTALNAYLCASRKSDPYTIIECEI